MCQPPEDFLDDLPRINLDGLPGDEDYDPTEETEDTGGEDETPWCRFGAHRRCHGEDCVCCEVYLEQRTDILYGPEDAYDEYDGPEAYGDEYEDEDTEPDIDESMDGDFDTGMASAGLGTDEDYDHYAGEDW